MADQPTLAEIYAARPRPSAEIFAFPAARVVQPRGPRPELVIFHGGVSLIYAARDDLVDDVLRAADRLDFDRLPRPERLHLVRQLLASLEGDA